MKSEIRDRSGKVLLTLGDQQLDEFSGEVGEQLFDSLVCLIHSDTVGRKIPVFP
jgi:hypothetical protein